jgi:hypothetical protein
LTGSKKCNGALPRAVVVRREDPEAEARIDDRRDKDGPPAGETASRYEPLDVPPLLPFWLACLLAAFVGGVLLSIEIAFPLATHQQYRGPLKPLPPAPRLETAPVSQLQRYDAAKRRELEASEKAMRETAKQGWGPPK